MSYANFGFDRFMDLHSVKVRSASSPIGQLPLHGPYVTLAWATSLRWDIFSLLINVPIRAGLMDSAFICDQASVMIPMYPLMIACFPMAVNIPLPMDFSWRRGIDETSVG
jgi:hypothetical protein